MTAPDAAATPPAWAARDRPHLAQVAAEHLVSVLAGMAGPDARAHADQARAVEALVADQARVLVVQATGWGKSAVYWAATSALRALGAGPTLVVSPLLALMRVALDLQTSGALFARIFEYLDLKPAIADRPDAAPVDPESGLGRIEFDHVVFRYPDARPGERSTLDDVSFVIEPGEFAAFVGPSGAGKTTVSYLIPRFYDATGGRILFAGTDVRDLQQESLVSHIGVVSQETYLFHATIAENLRYARPDATQEELESAAKRANIHETIVSFPDGYDTVVGERGYRLSGGEKQRIAIARVLLKDPEVLILDEATSALDTISERVVQQALDTASSGRTTIAIAHRLSTIVAADVIFVIDHGHVVESGTHRELLELGGVYSRLYREQSEGALLEE